MSNNIRNEKYLSQNDIGRPNDSGEMLVQLCGVKPPLPCIVILVHGVNDVGEAYQNQDEGLCAGLNTRLGRDDLHAHSWREQEFMIADVGGTLSTQTCSVEKQTCIGVVNRSPAIPFYWGYKPVDHAAFTADQQRYREELRKKRSEADLPYDTYQQDDPKIIRNHDGENIDNLNNWLDPGFAKGGGTFSNATTTLPDMFGPGARGAALEVVGKFSRSRMNDGDWSHPIYTNPHRIYQAYAARRLADLILAIRQNPTTQFDTINMVAHSQGTIITLLANMWVKAEGYEPADCVILNHSPYSLESRALENAQPGNQQTSRARQTTLANFCKLMATNPRYNGGCSHDAAYRQQLDDNICLHRVNNWAEPSWSRNNFGMVYNYFCPNDQVVSMLPVKGVGWSGVPDDVRNQLGDNFRQRVFCKGVKVGDTTGTRFSLPPRQEDDPEIPFQDASWKFDDITVNAPLLPVPFEFRLMAQDGGYRYRLSETDKLISRAAMKAERFIKETVSVPNTRQFIALRNGQPLSPEQIAVLEGRRAGELEIVDGRVNGRPDGPQTITFRRRMTKTELDDAVDMLAKYSQHSSIVCNPDVPKLAMAYDLAIGQNQAFEYKKFWEGLLLQADWRRGDLNPDEDVRNYYQKGMLPDEFRKKMNKPEFGDKPMPTGEFGVLNDYAPRQKVKPGTKRDMENTLVDILQWDMPEPQV